MGLLRSFTSVLLLSIVGLIANPIFAIGSLGDREIFVLHSGNIGNCTTKNIECKEVSESVYHCEESTSITTHTSTQCREIPTNSPSQDHPSKRIQGILEEPHTPRRLGKLYCEPPRFLYPFVSIIKIQV